MSKKAFINLENISKIYPNGHNAIKNVNFSINKGDFITILGPSGCGKTTILKMIAGFEMPTSGRIMFDNKDIKNQPIHQRPTATVFQDYALFPNMNVYQNITYGLKSMTKPLKDVSKVQLKKKDKVYKDAAQKAKHEILEIDKKQKKLINRIFVKTQKIQNNVEFSLIKSIKNDQQLENYLEHTQKKMHDNKEYSSVYRLSFKNRLIKLKANIYRNNKKIKYDYSKMSSLKKQAVQTTMLYNLRKDMKYKLNLLKNEYNKLDELRSYWQNYSDVKIEKYENSCINRKLTKNEIKAKASEVIEMVGLKDCQDKYPCDLSGGMQQRVALARAVVVEPEILLLDEPLSALDAKVREQMQLELKRLHSKLKLTFILVTHDQEEALFLSNKIIVMSHGAIEQIDSPKKIYDNPKSLWIANFIGKANIFIGKIIAKNKIEINSKVFIFDETIIAKNRLNSIVNIMIRPEDFIISENKSKEPTAKVLHSNYKGSKYDILALWQGIKINIETNKQVNVGDVIGVSWENKNVHIIPYKETQQNENK